MSDTPRTDAEASDGWSGDAVCVSADFARQLERELNACHNETLAVYDGKDGRREWWTGGTWLYPWQKIVVIDTAKGD